jgi:prepilin-type N-terminal cleavage/methylation domain-containing protein
MTAAGVPWRGGRPGAARRQSGFSLVEILVVITIIGVLLTLGIGQVRSAMDRSRVVSCQKHLRDIGDNMRIYKDQRNKGRWPKESGIRFLLTLYRDKQVTGRATDIFLCPGVPEVDNDDGGGPGSAYDDWDAISSDSIAYAGRDVEQHPIRNLEDEVIASDDNESGPNHSTATNILYSDGDVVSWDLYTDGTEVMAGYPELLEQGLLPVGPDSPYEPLRTLRVD